MYSSEVDLYEKMCDVEIRGLYGISESVNVEAVGRPSFSSALFSAHQSAELMQSVHVIDEMQPDMQDSGKSEVTAADDQHMAMTSMLASMQDDVHIACGNLSGKTFSYGSLCSLTICGDDVVDCTVSA